MKKWDIVFPSIFECPLTEYEHNNTITNKISTYCSSVYIEQPGSKNIKITCIYKKPFILLYILKIRKGYWQGS